MSVDFGGVVACQALIDGSKCCDGAGDSDCPGRSCHPAHVDLPGQNAIDERTGGIKLIPADGIGRYEPLRNAHTAEPETFCENHFAVDPGNDFGAAAADIEKVDTASGPEAAARSRKTKVRFFIAG